jgi:hypothetical protein
MLKAWRQIVSPHEDIRRGRFAWRPALSRDLLNDAPPLIRRLEVSRPVPHSRRLLPGGRTVAQAGRKWTSSLDLRRPHSTSTPAVLLPLLRH